MTSTSILLSNLGYLRGFHGGLAHHLRYAHRHVFCSRDVQEESLAQLVQIIERETPDICCFVEIDKGSSDLRNFNQLEALVNERYSFFDIENKYAPTSRLRHLPLTRGKSNGFIAKCSFPYEKLYFNSGTKRLIYKLELGFATVFFAHFSLKKAVRAEQLLEIRKLVHATPGEIILLGDFNIHAGFSELAPLLHENHLIVLNREDAPTFKFHRLELALDLCICTKGIAPRVDLKIIPQPYSDHEALLLRISNP